MTLYYFVEVYRLSSETLQIRSCAVNLCSIRSNFADTRRNRNDIKMLGREFKITVVKI